MTFDKKLLHETKNFQVWLEAEQEEAYGWFAEREYDDTPEQIAETIRKIDDTYELMWFCAKVSVVHKPTGAELGTDYLGACLYEDLDDFVKTSGYIRTLVGDAIYEARKTFAAMKRAVESTNIREAA